MKDVVKNEYSKSKTVAIIGAGLAGLSAGIYLRKAGFQTTIFEMHSLPGGQCTSWKKKGYTFDACVHWLIGSHPGKMFHSLWRDLGVIHEGRKFINHDSYMKVRFSDGESATIYTNADLLEKELLRVAPEDRLKIQEFTRGVRKATELEMPDPNDRSLKGLRMLIPALIKIYSLYKNWGKIKSKDYADTFQSLRMRQVILALFTDEFAMLFNLLTLAWLEQKNAGYPIGGSLKLARDIEKTYLALGGEIRYKSRVTQILTEKNSSRDASRVKGVEYRHANTLKKNYSEEKKPEVFHSDLVISAADGVSTVQKLLHNKHHHPLLKHAWETIPLFPPLFFISLGLKGKSGVEPCVSGDSLWFDPPVDVSWGSIEQILVHSMEFDPTLAPEGHGCLNIMVETDYDYWQNLSSNESKYQKTKESDTKLIINAIEKTYPGLKKKIQVTDIATPMTWVRYTGVYRGSWEGLQMVPESIRRGQTSLPYQLEGLEDFYLCGQWVEPGGGLPVAAQSGKNVAQLILKNRRK